MVATVDFEIVHKGQTEPIDIRVRDTLTDDLTDVAGTSSFSLMNLSDEVQDSGTFPAAGNAKMVRAAEGIYQYSFDADTYDDTNGYLLTTRCVLANETISQDIYVKHASAKCFAYAAQLRGILDKARKSVSDQIINMDASDNQPSLQFFYGYDSKHLIFYLEQGLHYINAIPPYTGLTIDIFPWSQYSTILLDSAVISGLISQGILGIDSDFSYSLGGNQLVIDHYTKISGMINQILTRFQKTVVSFKQMYRSKGLILFQFSPGGVRSQRVLNSMPSGWWSRLLSSVYQ